MNKRLRLSPDELQPLATTYGRCRASDKIVVDGEQVGFMFREPPLEANDSGWRFLAGSETEDYINAPGHLAFHDVNLVANCDPQIVPHLSAEVGVAFERVGDSFVETLAELP